MDEFEGAEELRRDRDLAPVFGATLEGPDANGAGVEVAVSGAQCEDLGNAGAGVSQGQREGLVGGLPGACGGLEETGALLRGEVFAATRVDQADGFGVRCEIFALRVVAVRLSDGLAQSRYCESLSLFPID